MNPVTCWYRFNAETQRWEYNHYEAGHTWRDKPEPKSDQQEVWSRMTWLMRWRYITDDKRIVD